MAVHRMTYRIEPDGCILCDFDHEILMDVRLTWYMGIMYQEKCDAFGGGVCRCIPKLLPFRHEGNAYDFNVPHDTTRDPFPETLSLMPDLWENPDAPPDRQIDFLCRTDGTYAAAFAGGFLPLHDGAPEIRRTSITDAGELVGSRKTYPTFAGGKRNLRPIRTLRGTAYKRYFLPQTNDASFYAIHQDGVTYLYMDFFAIAGQAYPLKADCRVKLLESQGVTWQQTQTALNVQGSRGYAVFRIEKFVRKETNMLAILIAMMILTFSCQSLFTRLYAAAYPAEKAAQATPVFSVVYGLFISAASMAVGGFSFAPSWQTVLLGLVAAGMLIMYNAAMIEAGNRGSYSFLMIASMFGGILVPMTVGVCFLGERLAIHQVFAVVLMLVSLVLMNVRGIEFKGNSRAYYLWCVALFFANGLFGALLNLQAEVMQGTQRTEMLTILYGASAVAAGVMGCRNGRTERLKAGFLMGKKAAIFLLLCCISATAAANLLLYILSQMDSAIYYTISDGGVLVVSIVYSLVLFKERPRWEQVIGMLTAVASLALINL